MEGLGVTASVIAVVNLSAKVIALCFQYSTSVANARSDITRLHEQVKILETSLQHARRLLEAPRSGPLSASRQLVDQLQACECELEGLRAKLEPSTARKAMRRAGLRALRWPFSSKHTESIIATLGRYQHNIEFNLQIDQTYVTNHYYQILIAIACLRRLEISFLASIREFRVCPFNRPKIH